VVAARTGAMPYGSNNNFVSISNHVPNINCEIWDLLHQKPEASADHSCGHLAVHDRKGPVAYPRERLNISTVHRFEVMLYKLLVYARLIHSSLFDLIEDVLSEGRAKEQDT
jgi:hypothetical protein